jgi:hypothetical protein
MLFYWSVSHRPMLKFISPTDKTLTFRPSMFCSTAPGQINLIVAVILFAAVPIVMQLPSQKDKSGKKDCPNRKAMGLLYKKTRHYTFVFGAQRQCIYLSLFPRFAVSLRCASGMPLCPGLNTPFLQGI